MEQIEFYSETEMSVYIVAFKTNEEFMYIFLHETSEGNRQRLYKWGKKTNLYVICKEYKENGQKTQKHNTSKILEHLKTSEEVKS